MTDKPKLKPCPFCGGPAAYFGYPRCVEAGCEIGCACSPEQHGADGIEKAAAWWNSRQSIQTRPMDEAPANVTVLVAGGTAVLLNGVWHSVDSLRPLEWEPQWWAPIPSENEPARAAGVEVTEIDPPAP